MDHLLYSGKYGKEIIDLFKESDMTMVEFQEDLNKKTNVYGPIKQENNVGNTASKMEEREFRDQIKKDLIDNRVKEVSDGTTAGYYELPADAREIQDLISYKNMNGQVAESFRSLYRYGESSHSDKLRDARKVIYYMEAEVERILRYES